MVSNKTVLDEVYTKAVGLAVKFAKDRAVSIAHEVCKRLIQAELYETVRLVQFSFFA